MCQPIPHEADANLVPEPSMFGLVGALAAFGGILMRRRRNKV
jgi:hypothetical protein